MTVAQAAGAGCPGEGGQVKIVRGRGREAVKTRPGGQCGLIDNHSDERHLPALVIPLAPNGARLMPKPRFSAVTWGLAAAAAGALLVGCSSEEAKLPKDEVANTVAEKLAAQTGQPKPDVTCPKDLVGKVGTTMRCKLTASDGSSLGVTVKVTSVDGDDIKYDIKADG
ncbi:protein of unknown function [Streptomyces sp. WMMB 322]|nr:protein of unknown function [Streptomyces sp. WMMB 322]